VLLADLNGDGRKMSCAGWNLDEVQAFDGSGRPLPGWPSACRRTPPAGSAASMPTSPRPTWMATGVRK